MPRSAPDAHRPVAAENDDLLPRFDGVEELRELFTRFGDVDRSHPGLLYICRVHEWLHRSLFDNVKAQYGGSGDWIIGKCFTFFVHRAASSDCAVAAIT